MDGDDAIVLEGTRPTVLIPTPGGRTTAQYDTAAEYSVRENAQIDPGTFDSTLGLNPLVNAASPLLAFLLRLRQTTTSTNPAGLREEAAALVHDFEPRARSAGVDAEEIFSARYVLCTAIDELVLTSAWGNQSVWATRNLLSTFHHEVGGGETFFHLLAKLSAAPARNLHMLELMYVVLSLGFEGKYRVARNGHNELEQTREQLFQIIRTYRGDYEQALSPQWRPSDSAQQSLARHLPPWVLVVFGLAVLTIVFVGFSSTLHNASEPLVTRINALAREPMRVVRKALAASPRLAGFLQPEIDEGLVAVVEGDDKTTIVIQGDGLFHSASATSRTAYDAVLVRIAAALDEVPGRIVVTGHTDNIPIRTLKYPSNWELSSARAENVREKLAAHLQNSERIRAEGRADTQPLVDNQTRANRARNRRVEIVVHAIDLPQ